MNIQTTSARNGFDREVTSPPSSPLTSSSSPLSEPPDEGDYKERNGTGAEGTSVRRSARATSQEQSTRASFTVCNTACLTRSVLATLKSRNFANRMSPASATSQPEDDTKLTQEVSILRGAIDSPDSEIAVL
jgi:histone demethylase JARID1